MLPTVARMPLEMMRCTQLVGALEIFDRTRSAESPSHSFAQEAQFRRELRAEIDLALARVSGHPRFGSSGNQLGIILLGAVSSERQRWLEHQKATEPNSGPIVTETKKRGTISTLTAPFAATVAGGGLAAQWALSSAYVSGPTAIALGATAVGVSLGADAAGKHVAESRWFKLMERVAHKPASKVSNAVSSLTPCQLPNLMTLV